MMKTLRSLFFSVLSAATLATACSDDPTDTSPDGGMINNQQDASVATCDPNAGSASVRLLNATLEQGVEVIKKTPNHPGPPGPNGLP